MQAIQSNSITQYRSSSTQSSPMLSWIAINFEKLNASDGSSEMPPQLQEAIIKLIMEKKAEDDIWISQNDITSALFCLEEKLTGSHKTVIENYRTQAETHDTLDSFLSKGAALYHQNSGREIFISVNEWTIPDQDMQFHFNNFISLKTQLNLAQTCMNRYQIMSKIHFWQPKLNPKLKGDDVSLDTFLTKPELRRGSFIDCDQIGKKLLSGPIIFSGDTGNYFPRETKFGKLTLKKIKQDELTIEEARKRYDELAPEIVKIYVNALKAGGFAYPRAQVLAPFVFDGLISIEQMTTFIHSTGKDVLVFTSTKLINCIYGNLITLDEVFQLSQLERYAIEQFEHYISDGSLTFNQIRQLAGIEMCVLTNFSPQFEIDALNITQVASFLKPLVEEMNVTYDEPWKCGEGNPQIKSAISTLMEKVSDEFLKNPKNTTNICSVQ